MSQKSARDQLLDVLEGLDLPKSASAQHQSEDTAHVSDKPDPELTEVTTGSHAKEQEREIAKRTPYSVGNTPESSSVEVPEGTDLGNAEPTGEDPANETSSITSNTIEDPGTTHPAKGGDGLPKAASMNEEELEKVASDEILQSLVALTSEKRAADDEDDEDDEEETDLKNKAQEGFNDVKEADEKLQAINAAQHTFKVAKTYRLAADLVTEQYRNDLQRKAADMRKAAMDGEEMPPDEGGAEDTPPSEGGGEELPPLPPEEPGAEAAMPGGGAAMGGEPDPMMLQALIDMLTENGMTLEDLLAQYQGAPEPAAEAATKLAKSCYDYMVSGKYIAPALQKKSAKEEHPQLKAARAKVSEYVAALAKRNRR